MENDIRPEYKHLQTEIDAVAKTMDAEALKAIYLREGIPWLEFVPSETNKPDIWYRSCNPENSDAPKFAIDALNESKSE